MVLEFLCLNSGESFEIVEGIEVGVNLDLGEIEVKD